MLPNKKSSILLVLRTLEEYTDEEHYLTQQEIADKIYQAYNIELERKSIGSSLSLLEELDYDIAKGPKGGFALLSRTFDETEATYLIDALFSSKSIDSKQAKKISEEISSCFSKYQRKDFSYLYKTSEINRTTNKQIMYNISVIHEAMKLGKRVGFQYLGYDKEGNLEERMNGYQYIVSPYYLVNNFGRYFLLCNYREKYRPIQIFRIDQIINPVIKDDWPIKKLESLKDAPKDFSITKYINDHIYMFDGETVDAELELLGDWAISILKDWFGDNAFIMTKNDKIFARIKCNETALYYWLMQYSDCAILISPNHLKERVIKNLKESLERYSNGK